LGWDEWMDDDGKVQFIFKIGKMLFMNCG
jgi:hypothetical protein